MRFTKLLAFWLVITLSIFGMQSVSAATTSFQLNNTKFQVTIEDFALCTGFQYDYTERDLISKGYETCKSQSISVKNFPASLHVKVRVEMTQSANDFYLSPSEGWDIRLGNTKGEVIKSRIAGPTVIPDKTNGNSNFFNTQYGTYYLILELASEQITPAGDYVLDASLCNSVCASGNIRTSRFKLGNFTIGGGVAAAPTTTSSVTTVLEGGTCKGDVTRIQSDVDSNAGKVASLFESIIAPYSQEPGLLVRYIGYKSDLGTANKSLEYWQMTLKQLSAEEPTCASYLNLLETVRVGLDRSRNASGVLEGNIAKAQYLEKTQNDQCTIQSLEAKSSVNTSAAEISTIANEISANEAKGGGLIDIKDPQTLTMLKKWNQTIANQSKTLQQWVEKLTALYKNDVTCANYIDVINLATEKISQGAATTASINGLIAQIDVARAKSEKSSAASSKKDKSGTNDDSLSESDGIEEEPQGELVATFNNSLNRFVIRVESNLPDESLVVRATKKGAKSLRFTLTTDEDGSGGIRTRTRLSGYTLVLYFGSQKLDQVRVR